MRSRRLLSALARRSRPAGVVEVAVGFTISTARMMDELMRSGDDPAVGESAACGAESVGVTTLTL